MDICQVETGLLKKKPCGQPGITHCVNCEQALCSKHAVPQLKESGQRTGKFLCKECYAAQKEAAKIMPASPPPAPAPKKADAPPPAPKPAAPAPAAAKTATPAPAAKPEPKKPDMDDSGPLEFTPTKK